MNTEVLIAVLGTAGAGGLLGAIWKVVEAFRSGADKRNLSAIEVAERQRDDARAQTKETETALVDAKKRAATLTQVLMRTRSYCASHHGAAWDDLPKLPEEIDTK